ncbi:MAG: CTP synthase [Dehalococcoidia bacterium]|nr:CTP synthase [Dehalococcoidia bacterium]
MSPKYIFITGGVVSSVGKGITAASIGRILRNRNLSVSIQKLDPYINVDPGTMSPYQHGEVFVTGDGAETDLDLGHYERFIDINLTATCNITSGHIYSSVIAKERRGEFLGGTIQVVPHITNEIKDRIRNLPIDTSADVAIIEVGGTVGDIEGLAFLEAIRQMRNDEGRENTLYIHVTLLPYLSASGELKTKPTQHSVNELRRIGIQPDIIICRADYPVTEAIKEKISLFCTVKKSAVIQLRTASSIYEVPIILEDAHIGDLITNMLHLPPSERNLSEWQQMVEHIEKPKDKISIALVGKYMELRDAYISVKEALCHAALYHDRDVNISWVSSEDIERDGCESLFSSVQGIVVPGGFGHRGIEGMIMTARYARENQIPYLGLCLGMHIMVIEYARWLFNSDEPNSTEFNPDTRYPVIDLMLEQKDVSNKGGTMRLGNYPCRLIEGSHAALSYDQELVYERHRHRFEFNNDFRDKFTAADMILSGLSPDEKLVEICEIANHPWMVGMQFHPEFKSRPYNPHPLFRDFMGIAKETMRDGSQPPLPISSEV